MSIFESKNLLSKNIIFFLVLIKKTLNSGNSINLTKLKVGAGNDIVFLKINLADLRKNCDGNFLDKYIGTCVYPIHLNYFCSANRLTICFNFKQRLKIDYLKKKFTVEISIQSFY